MEAVLVQSQDIDALAILAGQIWREYFPPIIGIKQTEYMVDKFQSAPAMRRQVAEDGYRYFFLTVNGERAGYTAIQPQGDALFLSKLYLKKEYRGRRLATRTLEFLRSLCRQEDCRKIWLTVNRHNDHAIAVYRALGFAVVREQATDIGSGFVMDDYVMECAVE